MNLTNENEEIPEQQDIQVDSLTSALLIVIPVLCIIILVILIYVCCGRKRKKKQEVNKSQKVAKIFYKKPTLNEQITYKAEQDKKNYLESKISKNKDENPVLSQSSQAEEQYYKKIKKLNTAVVDETTCNLPNSSSTRELVEKSKINSTHL
jgi:FtsZ-interacting cell division protein ZipA